MSSCNVANASHHHTSQIALNSKALTKVQKGFNELSAEIKALHDKILDVGGVRLKAQKAKVGALFVIVYMYLRWFVDQTCTKGCFENVL